MSLPIVLRIVLRPEAAADLLSVQDWYEHQRAGLGAAFTDAVDKLLTRIAALPELYVVVFRGVRRGKVQRFPYLVYYRVFSDWIEVIGVLHGSRDPQIWQGRA